MEIKPLILKKQKIIFLGLFLVLSCKTNYYVPIPYTPELPLKLPQQQENKEEIWIKREYIYSEIYPVT